MMMLYALENRGLETGLLTVNFNEGRTGALFSNVFNPALLACTDPEVAALWLGHTAGHVSFLRAFDEVLSYWVVPSPEALLSLVHFKGQANLPIDRVECLFNSAAQLRIALNIEQVDRLRVENNIDLGIWLDFDAEPYYKERVLAFVGMLYNWCNIQDKNKKTMVTVHFLTMRPDPSLQEMAEKEWNFKMTITVGNTASWARRVDAYVSLANEPTVYDPLAAVMVDAGCELVAPRRLDNLHLSGVTAVPVKLTGMLHKLALGSHDQAFIASISGASEAFDECMTAIMRTQDV